MAKKKDTKKDVTSRKVAPKKTTGGKEAEKTTSPKARKPAKASSPSKETKPTPSKAAATKPTRKTPAAKTAKRKSPSAGKARTAEPLRPAPTPEEFLSLDESERELPLEYGDTKVVLLVRDPEWIFAYWEINTATRRKYGIPKGRHNKTLVLRVIELDDDDNMVNSYDVGVNDHTASWYVKIDHPNHRYVVELGLLEEEGGFDVIATSNEVQVPRRTIAEETDLEFAEINDEIYSQLVHLSGGTRIRERLGSDEFLRSLQERVSVSLGDDAHFSGGLSSADILGGSSALYGPSSGLFSGALSSGSLGSAIFSAMLPGAGGEGALKDTVEARKGKDFWLEVGVDVIVYGATEPDAKVRLMGQDIELNPDGTFRLRLVLPDTTIEFPVEATSGDGRETRRVKPVVVRYTEGDPRRPS